MCAVSEQMSEDEDRDLLLSRIQVHLPTIRKYTYAKHLVARVEKLMPTAEVQPSPALGSSPSLAPPVAAVPLPTTAANLATRGNAVGQATIDDLPADVLTP